MSILFNKQERVNMLRPEEPAKWYVRPKSMGTISEKQVAEQMTEETTLNRKEAEMALAQLRKVILNNLKNGYTVKLGDWASFYLTVKSEGKERSEANANCVKKVNVRVRFDKTFLAEMQTTQFIDVESMVNAELAVPEVTP